MTSSYAQRGLLQKVKSADSQARALGELVADMAGELGMKGRIAFAGDVPLGFGYTMLEDLVKRAPHLTVDPAQPDVLSVASNDQERGRAGEDPPLLGAARSRR